MGEVFRVGQLVQYNDAWKKREYKFSNRSHDNHIHIVISYKQHNDKSYAYELFCTVDGFQERGGVHEIMANTSIF